MIIIINGIQKAIEYNNNITYVHTRIDYIIK